MDISQDPKVKECLRKNRELIQQRRQDDIDGWIDMFQFISIQSGRRIRRWTAYTYGVLKKINDPDDYNLPEIQRILNGQRFDDVDYDILTPMLIVYGNAQIAAVCEDLVLYGMVSIKVTQLDPFRAEWRMVLPG